MSLLGNDPVQWQILVHDIAKYKTPCSTLEYEILFWLSKFNDIYVTNMCLRQYHTIYNALKNKTHKTIFCRGPFRFGDKIWSAKSVNSTAQEFFPRSRVYDNKATSMILILLAAFLNPCLLTVQQWHLFPNATVHTLTKYSIFKVIRFAVDIQTTATNSFEITMHLICRFVKNNWPI